MLNGITDVGTGNAKGGLKLKTTRVEHDVDDDVGVIKKVARRREDDATLCHVLIVPEPVHHLIGCVEAEDAVGRFVDAVRRHGKAALFPDVLDERLDRCDVGGRVDETVAHILFEGLL